MVSDPTLFHISAFSPLAVSIYVPGSQSPITKHWDANATSYYSAPGSGDTAAQTSGASFVDSTESWLIVDGVDVTGPASSTCAIVAFGDSITDGFVAGSIHSVPESTLPVNANGRYPDDLQRRLDKAKIPVSVVDAGIAANELLSGTPITGPSGISRVPRRAARGRGLRHPPRGNQRPGADQGDPLGHGGGLHPGHQGSARCRREDLVGNDPAGLQCPQRRVASAPTSNTYREAVNRWIRGQKLADGVIDFDQAMREPNDPNVLDPAYASVDNLHPSLAGYREMAKTVPLSLLVFGGAAHLGALAHAAAR